MSTKKFKAAVKKFHGWIEPDGSGGIARFPSVYLKDEFLKYLEQVQS